MRVAIIELPRSNVRGVTFTASLEGRPIVFSIHLRGRGLVVGVPEVRTFDAGFDDAYVVNGWPAEVIQELLDAPTRRWLSDTYGRRDPRVEIEANTLHCFQYVDGDAVPDPASIGRWLDHVGGLGARLVSSFDRRRAAIAQANGVAAAEAWVAEHTRAGDRRVVRRKRVLVILLVTIAVFVLAPIVAVAIWLVTRTR